MLKEELESFAKKINDLINTQLKDLNASITTNIHKVSRLEEKVNAISLKTEHVEKTLGLFEESNSETNELLIEIKAKQQSIFEWIQFLKTKLSLNTSNKELPGIGLPKHPDQAKTQTLANPSRMHIQEFADEHVTEKVKEIKDPKTNYTIKLNCLAWLAQYREYINKKSFDMTVEAFKEVVNADDKNGFANAKHFSYIVNQIINIMRASKKGNTAEEFKSVLVDIDAFISILEIILINQQNINNAVNSDIFKDFVQYLNIFKSNFETRKCQTKLKKTLICMLLCFKGEKGTTSFLETPESIEVVCALMKLVKNDELVLYLVKMIKICITNEKDCGKVFTRVPNLILDLLDLLSEEFINLSITEEVLLILNQCTKKNFVLETISDPEALKSLCRLVTETSSIKIKEYSLDILTNCMRSKSLEKYLKNTAVANLILSYSDGNPT